jgi:AAA domain/UvrD-like helicase C-terminal domain
MAQFDFDNYIAKRTGAGNDEKIASLVEASRSKVAGLQQLRSNVINSTIESKQRNAGSVVSILQDITGADSDGVMGVDGLIGAPINNIVALGSGAAKVTGYIGSGIHDIDAMYHNSRIPEGVKEARARMLQGVATPADNELLALPDGDITKRPEPTDYTQKLRKDFTTNLQRITEMENSLDRAALLRKSFDLSSAVHSGSKDKLTRELGQRAEGDIETFRQGYGQVKNGEVLSGLGGMASGLGGALSEIPGAAVNNPLGATTFLADNAANIVASAAGRIPQAVSNVGYGLDAFGQGTEDFRKKNKGELPSNTELAENAALAAAAVGMEYAGDKLSGVTDWLKPAPKMVEKEAKTALKEALGFATNNVLTRTAGAVAKGGTGEFFTEGTQTTLENAIKNEDTTLNQAFEGGAIGAIIGGTTGTASHLGKELTGTTDDKVAAAVARRKKDADFAGLAKTNDTTDLLNPGSKSYDRVKAVSVLAEHAKMDDTTPEAKTANLAKSREVVQSLEADHDRNQALLDTVSSPSELKLAKEELIKLKAAKSSTDPSDAQALLAIDQGIAFREEVIALEGNKAGLKALTSTVSRSGQDLSSARKVQEELADRLRASVSPEEVTAHVQAANKPVQSDDMSDTDNSKQSVEALVNLSIVSPEKFSPDQALKLADNKDNVLTAQQRTYFREFSDARIAQNDLITLSDVSNSIVSGTERDTGLVEYNTTLGQALEAGDKKTFTRYMTQLANFAASHAEKQALSKKLFDGVKHSGDKQVLRVKNGGWEIVPAGKPLSKSAIKTNGGFEIHPNSGEFVGNIATESAAINQVMKAHVAAYTLKFGTAPEGIAIPSTAVATTATQAPSAGVAAAKGAAVVGGATQADTQTPVTSASNPLFTVNWNGLEVYPHTFEGMKPGEYKSEPLPHNPDMYEISQITEKGERLSGSYWIEGTKLTDFNITSEHGAGSLGMGQIRTVLKKIIEQHPQVTDIYGSRISGVRQQAQQKDVDVHFQIKNGKAIFVPSSVAQTAAAPTSVAPTKEVQSASSPVPEKTTSVKDQAEGTARPVTEVNLVDVLDSINTGISSVGPAKFVANKEQAEGIAKIQAFLTTPNGRDASGNATGNIFVLEGKAGTGKTSLVQEAVAPTLRKGKTVVVSAISHKAKGVLDQKLAKFVSVNMLTGKVEAYSLAALLGMKRDEETGNFVLDPYAESKIDTVSVLVVDEASMVNSQNKQILESRIPKTAKLIYIGDRNQIAPIEERNSPNAGKISEVFTMNAGSNKHSLVVRVRQGEDSTILPYADHYWNNAEEKQSKKDPVPDTTRLNTGEMIMLKATAWVDKVIPLFQRALATGNANLVKVMAFNNIMGETAGASMLREAEKKIRVAMFGKDLKEYNAGELLIMTGGYGQDEKTKIENSTELVAMSAKATTVSVPMVDGTTAALDAFLLTVKDTSTGKIQTIPVLATSARGQHAKITAEWANHAKTKDRTAWKTFWKIKDQTFAPVAYSYILTTHKAQGSTYDVAVVLEDNIQSAPGSAANTSRIMYTAITRAAKLAVIVSNKNQDQDVKAKEAPQESQEQAPDYDAEYLAEQNASNYSNEYDSSLEVLELELELADMAKIQAKVKDRTFRVLNFAEKQLLSVAIAKLDSVFNKELGSIDHFFIQESVASKAGTFFGGEGVIGLDPKIFTELRDGVDKTVEDRVTRILAHELAHARDYAGAKLIGEEYVYPSRTFPSMNSAKGTNPINQVSFPFDGSIYLAAKASMSKSPKLAQWFGFIMDGRTPLNKVPTELYAQLYSLYLTDKELMNEETGLAKARQAIEGDIEFNNQDGSAEAQPVDNGNPAASVGEAPSNDPSAEEEDASVRDTEGLPDVIEEIVGPFPGALVALNGTKSVPSTPYKLRNLLVDHFTQSVAGITAASKRPLVMVRDFLSAVHKTVEFTDYLSNQTLSEKQTAALEFFGNLTNETLKDNWTTPLQKLLVHGYKRSDGSWNQDKAHFFKNPFNWFITRDANGVHSIEENTNTALVYGALTTLIELADAPATSDDATINGLLRRDAKSVVPDFAREMLGSVGAWRNNVRSSAGETPYAALGLKANKDAGQDLEAKLQGGMGTLVVQLLLELELIVEHPVSATDMTTIFGLTDVIDGKEGENATAPTRETQVFIAVARDPKTGELTQKVKAILEGVKGSGNVLDTLFSVESQMIYPTFEAAESKQNSTKTGQEIPQTLVEVNDQNRAQANYARQDMWKLLKAVDPIVGGLAGVEDVSDETTQKTKRRGIKAKNDGLWRELNRYRDYMKDILLASANGINQGIHFDYSVWLQQRVGIATNVINPQTSKAHRALFFRDSWESEVEIRNLDMMDNFFMRVGEGFGVKTERDTMDNDLEKTHKKLDDPIVQQAIKDLQTVLYSSDDLTEKELQALLTPEQQANLLNAVKLGGTNFHTLDALVAMAHYYQALDTGAESFITHIQAEVDGVTNGPILAHALFGAALAVSDSKEALEKAADELNTTVARGGIFTKESGHESFPVWKSDPENKDLYENTTAAIIKEITVSVTKALADKRGRKQDQINAVYFFTGSLDKDDGNVSSAGRNFIKGPVTKMVYGEGLGKAMRGMGENFIQSVYDVMEKSANGDEAYPSELVLKHFNLLLSSDKTLAPLNFTEFNQIKMNAANTAAIKKSFAFVINKPVSTVIKEHFKGFAARRDSFNKAAGFSHTIYTAVYGALRNQLIKQLMDAEEVNLKKAEAGDTTVDFNKSLAFKIVTLPKAPGAKEDMKVREPLRDLSKSEERQLEKLMSGMLPVVQTMFSKDSNQPKAGLVVGKRGKRSSTNPAYKTDVRYTDKDGQHVTTTTNKESYHEAPGVSMLPLVIQSIDSYISHLTQNGMELLNIHDAVIAGLNTIGAASVKMNESTFHALLNYSPMMEMFNAMQNTVVGLNGLVRKTNEKGEWLLGDPVAEELAVSLGQFAIDNHIEGGVSMSSMLESTFRAALEADKIKLTAMKKWAFVNQYAHENSSYVVTDEDLALIDKKLAALSTGVPAKAMLAAHNIEEKMGKSIERLFDAMFKAKKTEPVQSDDMTDTDSTTTEANNSYSTHDVYNALDSGAVSTSFDNHLRDVLTNIVEKLHGAFGSFKAEMLKGVPETAIDFYAKALATGKAPFAYSLNASGFKFSDQQAFVAEQVHATILAALDSNDGRNTVVYTELSKLFRETRARLTPKDFDQGDMVEATALYNRIFNEVPGDAAGKSNYLAEFAALGLAHEGFNKLLKVPTAMAPKIMADRTISGMLIRLFNKVLELFNGKLTNTVSGQNADEKLKALVTKLVHIEVKRTIRLNAERGGFMKLLDKQAQNAREGKYTIISKLANSKMFGKNRNVFIAATSGAIATVADSQVGLLFRNVDRLRNEHFAGIPGVVSGFLGEMNGPKPVIQGLLRATKFFEGQRKKIITMTNKFVLQSFDNQGKDIDDEGKRSLTKVLLHTGAHVLLEHYDTKQLEAMLKDSAVLDKEINAYEAKLNQYSKAQRDFFIEQSRALGYYLVSGRVTTELMMKNANNIARMHMSLHQEVLTEAQIKEATKIIDELTSLYAMSYTTGKDKANMIKIMEQEHKRTDGGNGVRLVMLSHQQMEAQSKERLFAESSTQMVKGYVPEIYNPHTDVKAANAKEGRLLEDLGYEKGASVGNDPLDVSGDAKHLYVLRDGGALPWLSGIFSFTGMRSKGTKHHGNKNYRMQQTLTQTKQAAVQAKDPAQSGSNFDPLKVTENHMVPLLNDNGVAVNYQYMMQTMTKDLLLQRDTRFDSVMGALNGSIYDKENSAVHNRKAVELMFKEFDEGYNKEPKAYMEVSATSKDAELRELYQMLPQSTKDAIREVWGKDAMMVRSSQLDIAFGYRKLSLSNAFDKAEEDRNFAEESFVWFSEAVIRIYAKARINVDGKKMTDDAAERYAKRAAIYVRKGENVWQTLVKETKDIIVVKSGVVSLANIWSNNLLLKLYGVPTASILRDSRIAWVGAQDYARDTERLFMLESQLAINPLSGVDINGEIRQLKDAIARNPVREVIEAGLMPTIVEDISETEDQYSFKSEIARKTEKYTNKLNKLNKHVKNAAKQVYMAHDTQMYKTMNQITQLGDFVARYVLYQHLITRKDNPIEKKFAIQEASDAFINYDVPMNRKLQYLDDMGITPFLKYFMRIQRVIRGRFKHAPGKVALMLLAQGYLDFPTPLDGSILFKFGNNPFSWGALEFPGSLDEMMTTKAALSLFK